MASQVIRLGISSLVVACMTVGVVQSLARADAPEQYPYDPACPWGRLADGHGMLLRCLEPAEATQLLTAEVKARPSGALGSTASSQPAPAAGDASQLAVIQIGPAQADTGELPEAEKKLGAAKDKYLGCVAANGGVTADPARVVLRFLVRERGRAEGVTIKSVNGMSKKAAECIASVVDRRFVGYPSVPLVGATLPIAVGARR